MIAVSNLSKKFIIWEDRNLNLKETTINFLKGKKRSYKEIRVLRNINFEISAGETVGFIGENGSGKSTLLKLIGGIFVPDEGKIVTRGRISALFELGVGFHPDLTGEENIYLNGSMLGFDRKVMKKRFDEIVTFSEIGDFIYSPIRTYSSGMAMRLGFSIAMCVDPDVLLIDEVLAVGDEAFQKKCLKRMEELKSAGKTIVIVSHATEMVTKFCERVILLNKGQLIMDGPPEAVIDKYHAMLSNKERLPCFEEKREASLFIVDEGVSSGEEEKNKQEEAGAFEAREDKEEKEEVQEEDAQKEEEAQKEEDERAEEVAPPSRYERYGTFEAAITEVVLKNEKGEETTLFISGEAMSIWMKIRFLQDVFDPIIGIYLRRFEGGRTIDIYGINTLWKNIQTGFFKRETNIEVRFSQRLSVPEGEYYVTGAIAHSDQTRFYDWQENVRHLQVKNEGKLWTGIVDLNSKIFIGPVK